MKRKLLVFFIVLLACFFAMEPATHAQCSICTRTAQQLGEKPARGLNSGILYLAFAPFAIVGIVAYRWWKQNRSGS